MTCPMSLILLFLSLNIIAQKTSEFQTTNSEMDPSKSIISNTENSENHQTLLAVMRGSELEKILDDDGPFTVFAPSDLAFRKLSKQTLIELLKPENKKDLQALMAYHIIAGNFSASKILKAMCRGRGKARFTTLQGDELTFSMKGIDIILTDNYGNAAKITTADSNQCNGVIHVIDSVFRPSKI